MWTIAGGTLFAVVRSLKYSKRERIAKSTMSESNNQH